MCSSWLQASQIEGITHIHRRVSIGDLFKPNHSDRTQGIKGKNNPLVELFLTLRISGLIYQLCEKGIERE